MILSNPRESAKKNYQPLQCVDIRNCVIELRKDAFIFNGHISLAYSQHSTQMFFSRQLVPAYVIIKQNCERKGFEVYPA